jgi:hypothetical protein
VGLTLKTGQCLRVAGNIFGQELESDETVQADVKRCDRKLKRLPKN